MIEDIEKPVNSFLEVPQIKETKELTDAYEVPVSNISNIVRNIKDPIFHPLTCRLQYPHIALGSFARAFRDYIYYQVYRGFQGIIFGSYNRAIQSYLQRMKIDNTGDNLVDIGLPLFNYTFQIDNPDDKLDLPWRNTTYFPGAARVLYPSFYIDDDFELKVVYRRLKGTINMNIYCSSEAEQLDIQMLMYDGFRGLNTFSSAQIRAMTVLPDSLLFIDNHGRRITKALTSNKISKAFIPSINSTQYYIYNNITAILNLNSLSNSNNYYGGTGLPDYTLTGTVNFELDIPSYVMCLARTNYSGIEINLYTEYKYQDNKVIKAMEYITGKHIDCDIDKDPNSNIISFENGQIIDSVIYTVPEETTKSISIVNELFKDKELSWNYKNRDIIIFIIYAGGLIRLPIDNNIAEYDDTGNILFKYDLFNQNDLLEFYVFKLNKDLDI